MAHQYRLSKNVLAAIDGYQAAENDYTGALDELLSALNDDRDEHVSAFEDASERWQQSERGDVVQDWLNHLEEYSQKVDELAELIADLAIDAIEEKP